MNYRRIYFSLIRKALKREYNSSCLYERHHVIPKSISENKFLVNLSPKEHYICHKLLFKYFLKRHGEDHPRTKKMLIAFYFMSNRLGIKTGRDYTLLREKYVSLVKKQKEINRTFYHVTYGKFTGSIKQLVEKYPELSHSLLSLVANGKRVHHKGWSIDEKSSKDVQNKRHIKRKLYKFFHNVHGEYEGSIHEMKKIYKDHNLKDSYLYAVQRGSRKSHRGWKKQVINAVKPVWIHETYGVHEATISELTRLFSDLNLNKGHLSMVKNKKLKQHKGWRLLCE